MNKRNLTLLIFFFTFLSIYSLFAQNVGAKSSTKDNAKIKVKIGGYMQGVVLLAEKNATPTVGQKPIETPSSSYMRMGIRRGYLKFSTTYKRLSATTELKVTDKALGIYYAYLSYLFPTAPKQRLSMGLHKVPFGYELGISSKKRETFERAEYVKDLFPEDVDMGLFYKYSYRSPDSFFNYMAIDLGIVSGNALWGMNKALPNAIIRLVGGRKSSSLESYYGLSAYYGLVKSHRDTSYKRLYMGAFFDYKIPISKGYLKLCSEAIGGWQVGTLFKNNAVGSNFPLSSETSSNRLVERPFLGAMGMCLYHLSLLPLEGFVKYDYYNRDVRHSMKKVSQQGENRILYNYDVEGTSHKTTFGINYYFLDKRLRLSANYEWNIREESDRLTENEGQIKRKILITPQDDLLLLGVQFAF